AVAGEFRVDRRAAAARTIEFLEHEHPGAFADVHAGAAFVERAAGVRVHQPQQVEPAVREAGERVGTADEHRVGAPGTDRFHAAADRNRARRARGDDAGTWPLEAV